MQRIMPNHSILVGFSLKNINANMPVSAIVPPVIIGKSTLAGKFFAPSSWRRFEIVPIQLYKITKSIEKSVVSNQAFLINEDNVDYNQNLKVL